MFCSVDDLMMLLDVTFTERVPVIMQQCAKGAIILTPVSHLLTCYSHLIAVELQCCNKDPLYP